MFLQNSHSHLQDCDIVTHKVMIFGAVF